MCSDANPSGPWDWKAARPYWILVAVLLACDQVTKMLVKLYLPMHEPHQILGDWVQLTHIRNFGGAFGLQWEHGALYFIVASLVVIGLVFHLARHGVDRRLSLWAMALVLAGAIGNLIDRAVYGNVIDFIDVEFFDMTIPAFNLGIISHQGSEMTRWPIFNIADSCVTVGVILLLISMWRDFEIPRQVVTYAQDGPSTRPETEADNSVRLQT